VNYLSITFERSPTAWLSGSGEQARRLLNYRAFLAKRACARAAEPLSAGAVVGPLYFQVLSPDIIQAFLAAKMLE